MFPNGWPGRALLLLRLVAGSLIIHDAVAGLAAQPRPLAVGMLAIAAVAGLLLALGLWTPVAGAVVAIIEVSTAFMGTEHVRSVALLATVGIALALMGPGVWSIDARLFGRKRIDIPER